MPPLEAAIDSLLALPATSTLRLRALADYLIELLVSSGLPSAVGGSQQELKVPGLARVKNWDVAYEYAGKFRLLVSLKSMLKNISGTVPNRLDDLQGELANVQQLRPEIVIGYVILFDVAKDTTRQDGSGMWADYFEGALKRLAIRRAPLWNQGLLEGLWSIRFDSRRPLGQRIVDPDKTALERGLFVESMLSELKLREPAIPFTNPPAPPTIEAPE